MPAPLRRSWLVLAAALGMGVLAAFSIHHYIRLQVEEVEARAKAVNKVRVLVPKEDMPKGAPLTSLAIAIREIPAEWAHSNAIDPQQFDRIENQKLAYPAARGEALLWSLLEGQRAPSFSSRLAIGRRAITVPVDDVNSISGMIEPGDRIDLMVSVRKDSRSILFPLLQNAVVLATGSRSVADADTKEGRRTYTTLTLEAAAEDAQRILAAREIGKVAAVLRAPGDAQAISPTRRDAMALLGVDDGALPIHATAVPVLYGGRPSAQEALRSSSTRVDVTK
ncbi:MAG TPA: Flp pilus assembly protein CpaB [Albitalea sp.]|uniref:Flp pilus assembly protein CpaB n=1 Tax=Piscinibacter sp. TaxID=1903157 RepID=UPI002ED3A6E3